MILLFCELNQIHDISIGGALVVLGFFALCAFIVYVFVSE